MCKLVTVKVARRTARSDKVPVNTSQRTRKNPDDTKLFARNPNYEMSRYYITGEERATIAFSIT